MRRDYLVLVVLIFPRTALPALKIILNPKVVRSGNVLLLCTEAMVWPEAVAAKAGEQKIAFLQKRSSAARSGFVAVPIKQEKIEKLTAAGDNKLVGF